MLAALSPGSEPLIDVLMTRHPITITGDATVETAAALLKSCRIRHLPVTDGRKLAGILSLRDVLPANEGALVGAIMNPLVVTATLGERVTPACERLLQRHISSLPVVDGDQLVGIFTATDALRFAKEILSQSRPAARVEQLMTGKPLVTVETTSTLSSAWNLMREERVRHLPVMQGESLAGLLSDRDVLAAGQRWLDDTRRGDEQRALLVADAMSSRVVSIAPDGETADAARILWRRRVGALAVLRDGALLGVLTVSDFLYWILCRPRSGEHVA